MQQPPQEVLNAFPIGAVHSASSYGDGHVNATFLIEAQSGRYILQGLEAPGGHAIVKDMRAITDHLARCGLMTARIISAHNESLTVERDGRMWYLQTFVPGITLNAAATKPQARSAGNLLARFHAALAKYTMPLAHRIPHFHDTPYFMEQLKTALAEHESDGHFLAHHETARAILKEYERLPAVAVVPWCLGHGDPKLANIRFNEDGSEAIALLDLEALGRYPLHLEIGDALRSISKIPGPDGRIMFDAARYQAFLVGYQEVAGNVSEVPLGAIPAGFQTITLELAARYLLGGYNSQEAFFVLDTPRFASCQEHGLAKARECLDLLASFRGAMNAETP